MVVCECTEEVSVLLAVANDKNNNTGVWEVLQRIVQYHASRCFIATYPALSLWNTAACRLRFTLAWVLFPGPNVPKAPNSALNHSLVLHFYGLSCSLRSLTPLSHRSHIHRP